MKILHFIVFQNVTGMSPIQQEDFSELPPNQRRKKLQAKIDELTGKISQVRMTTSAVYWTPRKPFYVQETAARDGLMKMKTVYEANPALGDPMSIQVMIAGTVSMIIRECIQTNNHPQGQLTENGHRLDKLRADFRRYQGWLEEADGSPASTLSIRTGNGTSEASPRRSSVSDEVESLSRSASDSSVNHNKNGSLVTSIISQG